MGAMSLLDDLPAGAVVGIDSAVFIYFIEEHPRYEPVVSGLFEERLERGENQAITSVVTLAEVLVQPKRDERDDLAQEYRDFLTQGSSLLLVDITRPLAERGAALRAKHTIRLPDALQLAAALEHGATHFVTNDTRLRKVMELRVLVLEDYVQP
jgi:predicted nucleic acid-binding protein